jgi:DNA-binding XRE family transcriptional regulator
VVEKFTVAAFCPWNILFSQCTSPLVGQGGDREIIARTVGERIRQQRRQLNLTQEDVANIASLDRKHISSIETGKNVPGIHTLIRIARALQVPAEQLIEGLT